ncbi:MAG: argininosuccinate synthase [Planctomycetes bacterium]|nr:argininosuccinate synthase [Planctomycetota bacterium]MDP6423397.1 argininosuccinate synthase [Planctomycetota bacterium]
MVKKGDVKSVALAYSGGLDTSIIIPWLKEHYDGCQVHTTCGDVGQGDDELAGLEEKARASGAASCRIVDCRREFLEEVVWPCVMSRAVYERRYLLGTSMARPILARAQVDYALEVGADSLCHGCTGKGNDQVRFELAYQALAPDLTVIAPWRDWEIRSREEALAYANERGIPVTATREKLYSRDRNLWHISHEGGDIEDPGNAPPDDAWMLTADPKQAPDQPATVRVGFERGVPISIDGAALDAAALLTRLNETAAPHGVGRINVLENRLVGMKSRGLYETPGGTVLYEAISGLQALVLDRDTLHTLETLAHRFAELVYNGKWFCPEREALEAFFRKANEHVTGEVTVELYKGSATALAATSPFTLFRDDLATFGDSSYRQKDAEGFIRLYGLPLRVAAERRTDS